MALLEVSNLNISFGGLRAVSDVSFSVRQGMIKSIIGPNGAGKTTLFNLISGSLRPDSGAILFRDRAIHARKSFQIANAGLARTFQNIKLFPGMTVLENVMIGRHIRSRAGFLAAMFYLPWTWLEEKSIRRESLRILEELGIAALQAEEAVNLSFGQQRAVEFARALALEPTLLLLDEPAAGLNIYETAEIAQLISKIRERGITVLLVEHDMSLVMDISDEILVLSFGEKIAEDVPASIQRNEDVIRIYLGEDDV